MKKGKKKVETGYTPSDVSNKIRDALKGRQIPVLILDPRWIGLFQQEEKPIRILQLEGRVRELMAEQGKLVNEIKHLKKAKKRLMDGIVSNIGHSSERKSQNSKRLILEMNEQIDDKQNRVMELPYQIQELNTELLVAGLEICYQKVKASDSEVRALTAEIELLRSQLLEKTKRKEEIEKGNDAAYGYMHDMLGANAMNMFDRS